MQSNEKLKEKFTELPGRRRRDSGSKTKTRYKSSLEIARARGNLGSLDRSARARARTDFTLVNFRFRVDFADDTMPRSCWQIIVRVREPLELEKRESLFSSPSYVSVSSAGGSRFLSARGTRSRAKKDAMGRRSTGSLGAKVTRVSIFSFPNGKSHLDQNVRAQM